MAFKNFPLIITILMAGCASIDNHNARPEEAVIESEVLAAFDQLVEATTANDLDRYFLFFNVDTFTALTSDGSVSKSFENFRGAYEPQLQSVTGYKSLVFDPVHVCILDPNNAVLFNEYTADVILTSGHNVSIAGSGAQFWFKSNGEWRLVHISSLQKQSR